MIASVHITDTALARSTGLGRPFFQIDLMKGSLEQMRTWLSEKGIVEEDLLIYGFEDLNVESVMSLRDSYRLKSYICDHCDGDEFLVAELLRKRWPVDLIINSQFIFAGDKEVDLLTAFFSGRSARSIATLIYSAGSVNNLILQYTKLGKIIWTSRGYYISKSLE